MGEPKGYLVVPVGYNPSDRIRALELDVNDNLKVSVENILSVISQSYGYISGAWQKSAFPWGFSGSMLVSAANLALPGGVYDLDSTLVPAGEYHYVMNVCYMYSGTPPGATRMLYKTSAAEIYLIDAGAVVSGVWYPKPLTVLLGPGDRLALRLISSTLNDSAHLRYTAMRIDVDQ